MSLLSMSSPLYGGNANYVDFTYGQHDGYLLNVGKEKHRKDRDIFFVTTPQIYEKGSQEDIIFNTKLKKDITDEYERKFGYPDIERNWKAPSSLEALDNEKSRSEKKQTLYRKERFGKYMGRKILEYHFDDYFKSRSSTKVIYEVKNRISNSNISIRNGYKVKFGYSYANNYLKMRLKNPYNIKNKLMLQMDGSFISSIQDVILYLGYDFTKKIILDVDYSSHWELVRLKGHYKISSKLKTSLSLVSGFSEIYDEISKEKSRGPFENKVLFGISWQR